MERVLNVLTGEARHKLTCRHAALSALFHAYADMGNVCPDESDRCSAVIDAYLDVMPSEGHLGLYGGWTGLGWLTSHFDVEEDVVGVHVDGLLSATLPTYPPKSGYDLISGLVGIGVYFIERLPSESATRGLGLVLDALEAMSSETNGGTTWFTAPELLPAWQRERAPNGYYNLGVAHGVPGVCWLLAKLCIAGIQEERARILLCASLRWLRSTQPDPERAELPSWIAPGVARQPNRRLAWCYGPLGTSAVALGAARAIGDRETIDWARTMALACAAILPEEAGIRDAGLCHGAAGNAQVFYRLARSECDARFSEAGQAWLRTTLDYWKPGAGIGGYQMWSDVGDNRQAWVDDGSFLTGSAGVGLALLAGMGDIEPEWDRLLLLS